MTYKQAKIELSKLNILSSTIIEKESGREYEISNISISQDLKSSQFKIQVSLTNQNISTTRVETIDTIYQCFREVN